MKATVTLSACILVTVFALIQLPAFNARDLTNGKRPPVVYLGTSAAVHSVKREAVQ